MNEASDKVHDHETARCLDDASNFFQGVVYTTVQQLGTYFPFSLHHYIALGHCALNSTSWMA